jgi:hypothetical protein
VNIVAVQRVQDEVFPTAQRSKRSRATEYSSRETLITVRSWNAPSVLNDRPRKIPSVMNPHARYVRIARSFSDSPHSSTMWRSKVSNPQPKIARIASRPNLCPQSSCSPMNTYREQIRSRSRNWLSPILPIAWPLASAMTNG